MVDTIELLGLNLNVSNTKKQKLTLGSAKSIKNSYKKCEAEKHGKDQLN